KALQFFDETSKTLFPASMSGRSLGMRICGLPHATKKADVETRGKLCSSLMKHQKLCFPRPCQEDLWGCEFVVYHM
ncbi:hypothetical protein BOQ60_26585, partial [Chryseobacterium sp. CH1]